MVKVSMCGKHYQNKRTLTFENSTNINEWLGVLVTKVYRYVYIFHNASCECDKWLFTDWVHNRAYNIVCAYNHSFKCAVCTNLMSFPRRLWMFVSVVPPVNIVLYIWNQIKWRAYRKRLGHTWLRWRL